MITVAGESNVPMSSILLPPGREVPVGPSPSDVPYHDDETHSRLSPPFRRGTAIPPLGTNIITKGYASAPEAGGSHPQTGSVSSLHLSPSLQTMDSSVNHRTFHREPSWESVSHLSSHELPRSHSRQQINKDDAHSMCTLSTRRLAPDTRHASSSCLSVSTSRSLARSVTGSESRQSAYRKHEGPVHSRPVSVRNSITDQVYHGSPGVVVVPGILPQADINPHAHYVALPGDHMQPGSEVMVHDGPPITAMVANDVKRYERCIPRDRKAAKTVVPAMTFKFRSHDMDVPEGWTALVHPEGARYFVNEVNRTFTDMNICDQEICDDIKYYMQYLRDELQRVVDDQHLDLDMQQVDLVVEPKVFDDHSVVCCYYFTNHRDRCLFWLDEYDPHEILSGFSGVESLSHIQNAIQAQYWRHWDYFPSLCPVTQKLVDDVKNMLLHATCDHLTSTRSSAIFDIVELRDHIGVVEKIKVYPPEEQGTQPCHAAIVIGRVMYSISHNNFINFHGEDCVRLNSEQSVHGWKYKPSLLMRALTFLLFFDPVIQVQEMHNVFVDEIVRKSRWDAFTSKFKGQLQDSNLLATVLLNANVGFLAITTVDRGGRDITQMASYMSLVTSLASIVLGLVFVSRDRTSGRNTAAAVADYIGRLHDQNRGLEQLAIIYSLPKALLMWGIVFFFVSFSTDWWIPGDRKSRLVVGIMTLIVFMTLLYGIVRTLDRDLRWWAKNRPHQGLHRELLSRLASAWKRVMVFIGMERDDTQEPQSDAEEVHQMVPINFLQETKGSIYSTFDPGDPTGFRPETPGAHDQENHSEHPTPHDGTHILLSSDSHTNTGLPLGVGTLQEILENAQATFQEQSTAEGRFASDGDSDPADIHLTTSPHSAPEGTVDPAVQAHSDTLPTSVISMSDSGGQTEAAILSDPLCTEEGQNVYVFEEPGELEDAEHSHHLPSSTPPVKIYAKSATDDYFHHAPVPTQWTLRDGYDIEECKD